MIRRIFDFIIILIFVWVCMLFGLWIISNLIVPLSVPGLSRYLISIMQVGISSVMVLIWLQIWRWLARYMFWRALQINQNK